MYRIPHKQRTRATFGYKSEKLRALRTSCKSPLMLWWKLAWLPMYVNSTAHLTQHAHRRAARPIAERAGYVRFAHSYTAPLMRFRRSDHSHFSFFRRNTTWRGRSCCGLAETRTRHWRSSKTFCEEFADHYRSITLWQIRQIPASVCPRP